MIGDEKTNSLEIGDDSEQEGNDESDENDESSLHAINNDSSSSNPTLSDTSPTSEKLQKSKTRKPKSVKPWAEKKKKESDLDRALLQTATSLTQHLQKSSDDSFKAKTTTEEPESEESLFLKSLVPRMVKLPPRAKAILRMNIEQLFFQAEFPSPPPTQFQMNQTPQQEFEMGGYYDG